MLLDHDACYRVFSNRDGRFDGRIFVGVRTTGIYCRPICPAPAPKQENVCFFDTAVQAQQAGFRPCLRCRPEVSPQFAAWKGSSNTVARALRLIESGALDVDNVECFANRLGVGARQLRRLFIDHAGAPPTAFAHMRRVHLAKQLLQETTAPIIEIAHAAGFASVRRFNEAFRDVFGFPPSQIRRSPPTAGSAAARLTLRLGHSPPYDWNALLDALESRAIDGVEDISDGIYRRTFVIGGQAGSVAIRPFDGRSLQVECDLTELSTLPTLLARVRSQFDQAADPQVLAERFGDDPWLGNTLRKHPGIRIVGPWSEFEHIVRTALDWDGGGVANRERLGQFARSFGRPLDRPIGRLTHCFPAPEDIAAVDHHTLFCTDRVGQAVSAYARATVARLEPLHLDNSLEEATAALWALSGFDRSLAESCASGYLWPTDDVRVGALIDLARLDHWRPWRAYAVALLDRHH